MAESVSPSIKAAEIAFAITPSDTVDLAEITRGLYVGVSGDVEVILDRMTAPVVFVGLAAGVVHPLRVRRVLAANTTATDLMGVA